MGAGMIFNMAGGGGTTLNFTVKGFKTEDSLPINTKENTIAIFTDTEITSWIFSAKNPFVTIMDINHLDGVSFDDGYLNSTGVVCDPDASNSERYTVDYIPVEYGKDYNYTYSVTNTNSMWLAVYEYTGSNENYIFSKRNVLVDHVSGTKQTGIYTPSSTNVTAVRLSWCTFSDTDHVMSFIQKNAEVNEIPANANGTIWIETGNSSAVAFNALKKNGIMVYPLSAKQYVSGEWVDVTAKSYQGGEWVEWIYYIVRNGVMIRDLSVISKAWDSEVVDGGNNTTLTEHDGYLSVNGSGKGYGAAYTEEDLTGKQSITIEGDFPVNENSLLAVWSSVGPYITSNMVASVRLSDTVATLDVSGLSGKMLVGITTVYINEWKIVNMYLE